MKYKVIQRPQFREILLLKKHSLRVEILSSSDFCLKLETLFSKILTSLFQMVSYRT